MDTKILGHHTINVRDANGNWHKVREPIIGYRTECENGHVEYLTDSGEQAQFAATHGNGLC